MASILPDDNAYDRKRTANVASVQSILTGKKQKLSSENVENKEAEQEEELTTPLYLQLKDENKRLKAENERLKISLNSIAKECKAENDRFKNSLLNLNEYERKRIADDASTPTLRASKKQKLSSENGECKGSAEEEELREENKRLEFEHNLCKVAMKHIAKECICPISHELMFDPVMAKDRGFYERKDIEKVMMMTPGDKFPSPRTGKTIGKFLEPSPGLRNIVAEVVESRAVESELTDNYLVRRLVAETTRKAERGNIKAMRDLSEWNLYGENGLPENEEKASQWLEKAENTEIIEQLTCASEKGDSEAMYSLGNCHRNGEHGLLVDKKKAFHWYEKSADLNNPKGMACAGYFIAKGCGGAEVDDARGISLTSVAARMGSDFACFHLGKWYKLGKHLLRKNKAEAKHWLTKAIDGSCEHTHLSMKDFIDAKEWLKDLEGA